MNQQALLDQLNTNPQNIEFNDVIDVINTTYNYTPTTFKNGPELINQAGSNEGSCKIFSFAKQHNLSETQTLHCFGDYYRKDVLGNPDGNDHANIRSFMSNGWLGIAFEAIALTPKQ